MQTQMTIESQEITLEDLAAMMQRGFGEVRTDMRAMESRIGARIDGVELRIDSLEGRFDTLDGSMNSRFSSLQGQMDNIYLNYTLRKRPTKSTNLAES